MSRDSRTPAPRHISETIVSKPALTLVNDAESHYNDSEPVVTPSPEASAFADQLREVASQMGNTGSRLYGRNMIDIAAARIEREGHRYDLKCAELRDAYKTIEALEHEIRDLKTPLAIDVDGVLKSAKRKGLWARIKSFLS